MLAPQMIDTDLIRTFLAINDTGSFSAAAKAVLRTPSAVSMQVKRLEEQLGRVLFERLPREVLLTGDGEAFLAYAEEIMRVSEAALSERDIRAFLAERLQVHKVPRIIRVVERLESTRSGKVARGGGAAGSDGAIQSKGRRV